MARRNGDPTPRRDTGGAAPPGPDAHPAPRSVESLDSLIELVLSWGATADPEDEDLLGTISEFESGTLGLLRALSSQGRGFLSPPVWEELSRAAARLPPPSTVPLDDLLAKARGELASTIETRRAALLSELQGWASQMDFIQVTTLLGRIRGTEGAASAEERIAAAQILMEAAATLEQVRGSLSGRLDGLLSSAAGAAPPDVVKKARAALAGGDPREVSASLRAMKEIGSVEAGRRAEVAWRQARADLEGVCARARGAGAPPGPILAEALSEAERILKAGGAVSTPGEMEAHTGMLGAWERALVALVDGQPGGAGDDAQKSRQALAEALQKDIARQVALDLGLQDQKQKIPAGDVDGTARKLLEVAISGGGSFQEAFDNALALARKVRGRSESRLRDSSTRLRAAAAGMTSFLEKGADQLPTARVVQARLWLDQVEGIIASAEIPSMDSMTHALADDLKELGALLELARKRKQSREAGERESLKAEAARLLKGASGKSAERIQALAGQADRADAKMLVSLREQLERAGSEVEQSVRLRAALALSAGERLLGGRKGKGGSVPEKLRPLDEKVGALRSAMEKDDLGRLVSLGGEVGSAVAAASPLSRPAIRIALAGLALALLAGGILGWRWYSDRPETFRVKLAGGAGQSVTVRLASEGRFVTPARQAKGEETIEFALDPGSYEVFVNDIYTGRVIHVPGPADAGEVPIPQ